MILEIFDGSKLVDALNKAVKKVKPVIESKESKATEETQNLEPLKKALDDLDLGKLIKSIEEAIVKHPEILEKMCPPRQLYML